MIIGSALTPSGGLMYAKPSVVNASRDSGEGRHADWKRPSSAVANAEGADKKPADWVPNERRSSGAEGGESGSGTTWSSAAALGSSGGVGEERGTAKEIALAEERSGKAGAATAQPAGGFVQDPFLHGVNCYAEVFLEVPDTTLSGILVDPKAVTVYPTTRVYGGVSVQKEVLTGKYVIWNMAGEVRGSHSELEFDEQEPLFFGSGVEDGSGPDTQP